VRLFEPLLAELDPDDWRMPQRTKESHEGSTRRCCSRRSPLQ
jgi:hypothetical protein